MAIADPTRRSILDLLGSDEMSVTTLASRFPTTLSAISQHIRVLREVGLVTVRQHGRERFYRMEPLPLRAVMEWVGQYETFWNDKLDALGTHLEETP